MARIAIEQALSRIRTLLEQNQFETVDLNLSQQTYVPGISCYIISGMDKDFMGITNKQADLPVINAHGMTDDEVLQQVKEHVQLFESAK